MSGRNNDNTKNKNGKDANENRQQKKLLNEGHRSGATRTPKKTK